MTQKFSLSGVVPPVVVPLNDDKTLDKDSFAKHINRLIDAGVQGLFLLGSSGEVAFFDDEQRKEVIQFALDVIDKRLPVLVGCIDTQTNRVIAHAQQAEALGADAIVVTAPFYALLGPNDVENHFRKIHQACSLPLFAYDIPVCVHTKLDYKLLVKLGQEGVVSGVKDSSGDDIGFRYLCLLNQEKGHPLSILTGHEVVVDGAYLSGADGSVPGLANIDPYSYVAQYQAYKAGQWDEVKRLQDHLAHLMTITSVTQNVSGFGAGVGAFKTALWKMGIFKTNQMSDPVSRLEGRNCDAIEHVLHDCRML